MKTFYPGFIHKYNLVSFFQPSMVKKQLQMKLIRPYKCFFRSYSFPRRVADDE